MATQLDLDEQEQLDKLKRFWAQFGNAITWLLIAVLGSFAAYNGWQWWQSRQSIQASGLYEAIELGARREDVARVEQAWQDLRGSYAGTTYAQQGGLLAARVFHEEERVSESREALAWVSANGPDAGLRAVARLRLAAVLLEAGSLDEAQSVLNADMPATFAALREDRLGDVLLAQGKTEEASAAFERAYRGMDEQTEYRQLVEAKWIALGGQP